MAKSNNIKFTTEGTATYTTTLKDRGLYINSKGMLAISENKFTHGNIPCGTELKYLGKAVEGFQGQHCFERADGTRLVGHPNHFNADSAYYKKQASGGNKKVVAQPAAPSNVTEAEAQIAKLQQQLAELEALKAGLQQTEDEIPEETVNVPEENVTDEVEVLAETDESTEEFSDFDELQALIEAQEAELASEDDGSEAIAM